MALLSLNLSDLNGDNGFIINGAEQFDYSGTSVSSAGDINGDGIDDLIIGAPHSLALTVWTGESYIIFGKSSGFNANFNLASVNGNNGFVIKGAAGGYNSGISVSRAGDVNNDGIDDLIIGAPSSYNFPGLAVLIAPGDSYVLFGKNGNFASSFDLEDLNGSNGFHIRGIEAGDLSGISVSNAGDVNDDGIDDLIIGASRKTSNGQNNAGESYVVFGSANGFNTELKLGNLDGNNGFRLRGIGKNDNAGNSVSNAGDINGDGIDDLIIAAPDADANGKEDAGETYIVFGSGAPFAPILNLANLDGDNGFVIQGINAGDRLGGSISNAGDVNGDGVEDLIIGAASADPNGKENAGETYVIFGKTQGFNPRLNLEKLNGNNGFVIQGITAGDNLGSSVSVAGDVNGDGIDDLVIGADDADPNGKDSAGITYVLFGKAGGFGAVVNLKTINSNNGFALNGIAANDTSGVSVSDAGDVNGDGIDDLVIGAWLSDSNGSQSGQSYVVFGVSVGITLNGGDENDTLNGGNGNDTLIGNGGNDTLIGGVGNDRLVGGKGNDRLVGGSGNDTMIGGAGNDSYTVGGTFDVVTELASQGRDLVSSAINYTLVANVENLTLLSATTATTGRGNTLNNLITGNSNANTLSGGDGNDTLNGGAGNDRLVGGKGNDRLVGDSGNDTLNGGVGSDRLYGEIGNDVLYGNAGNDILFGGRGNDRLIGGTGNDILYGEGGTDTFVLDSGKSSDTIRDYQVGIDTISLGGLSVTLTQSGSNVLIKEGSKTLATVLGVTTAQLSYLV